MSRLTISLRDFMQAQTRLKLDLLSYLEERIPSERALIASKSRILLYEQEDGLECKQNLNFHQAT